MVSDIYQNTAIPHHMNTARHNQAAISNFIIDKHHTGDAIPKSNNYNIKSFIEPTKFTTLGFS